VAAWSRPPKAKADPDERVSAKELALGLPKLAFECYQDDFGVRTPPIRGAAARPEETLLIGSAPRATRAPADPPGALLPRSELFSLLFSRLLPSDPRPDAARAQRALSGNFQCNGQCPPDDRQEARTRSTPPAAAFDR
jgi:hypothetical protein